MPELYEPEGFYVTTLSSDINASTTTIPLGVVPSRVTKGYMVIEPSHATKREVVHFTSVGASSVTTADDTTDASDATGRGCLGSITAGANTSHLQGVTVLIAGVEQYWDRIFDSLANVLVASTGAVDGTKVMKITSTDGQLATGGNIQVNSADPKRTMYIPASAMYPSTTAPCASISQVESTTNDVNIKVLDFDGAGTAKEYAEFGVQSPSYWDASTITVQFIWYAAAGSGTVNWEIQGLALSDDDALDTAYGTLQEVTDTLLATGDVHISAETAAITIAGTPVAGDWLQFKVARDPNNDTNTSDAGLMGIRIRFGVAKYDDQ